MTCIIGFADKDKVYIGGDSAGVSGYSIHIRADEKVFRNGPFIMGFTSSFRMGQLLRYVFQPPEQPADMDDRKFMVAVFIPAVKKCFKSGGFQRSKDGGDRGGAFLVGYKGRLYEIDEDYQVGLLADNVASVGCGESVALGAMYGLAHTKLDPIAKILKALEITSYLNAGVRPPFIVETLSIHDTPPLTTLPLPSLTPPPVEAVTEPEKS
jgi:ATP-dependent protease HslVU (ClpYQ) peptidase subunit